MCAKVRLQPMCPKSSRFKGSLQPMNPKSGLQPMCPKSSRLTNSLQPMCAKFRVQPMCPKSSRSKGSLQPMCPTERDLFQVFTLATDGLKVYPYMLSLSQFNIASLPTPCSLLTGSLQTRPARSSRKDVCPFNITLYKGT